MRSGTALAIGVVYYAGGVTLTGHYDPKALSEADAKTLFQRYHLALRGSTRSSETERASLEEFIEKHALRRAGATALRSLPMGKHAIGDGSPLMPVGRQQETPALPG